MYKKLIELKVDGREVVQVNDREEPKILNLMDALKKSVAEAQARLAGGPPVAAAPPTGESGPADAAEPGDKKLAPSSGRKKGARKVEG